MEEKGTRNAIFTLRVLAERAVEMQRDLFLCFIDYEKAFDRVLHQKLIEDLEQPNIDGKDIRAIKNLYWNQIASVKIEGETSQWVSIKRGVRQGCVFSPDSFNLYSERALAEIEHLDGIKVGGVNVNNIRYADDTVLIADSQEKLQALITTAQEAGERRGLKINTRKSETLVITKKEVALPISNMV